MGISSSPEPLSSALAQLEEEGAVIRNCGGVMLSREEGDQPIDRKTYY
ncbi:hypothetical protein [Sodalis-like endosymbiont of Proechinophthirus fluctus]